MNAYKYTIHVFIISYLHTLNVFSAQLCMYMYIITVGNY